jgi:hypothetical protein
VGGISAQPLRNTGYPWEESPHSQLGIPKNQEESQHMPLRNRITRKNPSAVRNIVETAFQEITKIEILATPRKFSITVYSTAGSNCLKIKPPNIL